MPNLEQKISHWRRAIAKAADHRQELLDELEAHLREEIDRSVRAGLPEEKAFEAAVAKLGTPSAVAAEYDKLTADRGAWWPVKVARVCAAAVLLLAVAVFIFKLDKLGILLAAHVWCVIIGYLTLFVIGGLGLCHICAGWFGRPGPIQRHSLVRSIFHFANLSIVLTTIAVVLGMFWAKENWGRYWAWDPKETGAALVILSAFLISALQWFRARQGLVVSFAVLSSAITTGAWFGVNSKLSAGAVHPLVIAFIAAHLLILASVPAVALLKRRPATSS